MKLFKMRQMSKIKKQDRNLETYLIFKTLNNFCLQNHKNLAQI